MEAFLGRWGRCRESWPTLGGSTLRLAVCRLARAQLERGAAPLEERVGSGAQNHLKAPVHGLLSLGGHGHDEGENPGVRG